MAYNYILLYFLNVKYRFFVCYSKIFIIFAIAITPMQRKEINEVAILDLI